MDKDAKNNSQAAFPEWSKLCEQVVYENIAKINGIRSVVKTNFWQVNSQRQKSILTPIAVPNYPQT